MKSLDIIVVCKLMTLQARGVHDWSYARLAEEICLSVGETHASVKRLERSRLFDVYTRSVIPSAIIEFLLHGLKYAFPGELGTITRGIATAHSAKILSDQIVQSDDVYVWPYGEGDQKGISLKPLSKNTPAAALKDPVLYDLLALIDAVRTGKSRERVIASEMLENMIRNLAGNDNS